MTTKVINPKTLRKSNKVNIKFILWSKGDMSRLHLAKELKLTNKNNTTRIKVFFISIKC